MNWVYRLAALTLVLIEKDAESLVVRDEVTGSGVLASQLLKASDDHLILLFTADTQYNYECVETNMACKQASRTIRDVYGLTYDCDLSSEVARAKNISEYSRKKLIEYCVQVESEYSNDLQRGVMGNLVSAFGTKPSALVLNGDLTSYGHPQELEQFKKNWLTFPVRVLPGLGNHDYENNVDDCLGNHCANRMLSWFVDYAQYYGLNLDYTVTQPNQLLFWKKTYSGSFAYSLTVCSANGETCAKLIQLNNRINYATQVDSILTQWVVRSSNQWLNVEMKKLRNTVMPIFINLHHLDADSFRIIKDVIKKNFNGVNRPPIFVLFAHFHHMHSITNECAGYDIPFIFIGSVPNDRFTVIKVKGYERNSSEVYLMASNEDNSTSIVNYLQPNFKNCVQPDYSELID